MKANQSHEHTVYVLTNIVNEKWYVGKTGVGFGSRWKLHKRDARNGATTYLHQAIRKHGEHNFQSQIIGVVSTAEEATNLERIWILLLESHKPHKGYNLTLGGEGQRANEETRKKISATRISRHYRASPKQIQSVSKELPLDRILELFKAGKGCADIGKQVGASHVTVRRRLRKMGITNTGQKGRWLKPHVSSEKIHDLRIKEGKTFLEIGNLLGVSKETARRRYLDFKPTIL
jgi:group I intron endonuclease